MYMPFSAKTDSLVVPGGPNLVVQDAVVAIGLVHFAFLKRSLWVRFELFSESRAHVIRRYVVLALVTNDHAYVIYGS